MIARVTLFEIDVERTSAETALQQFKELILPDLRIQPGYQGVYVLRTSEGNGLLMSLWESEEAANAGIKSGYYDRQISKLVTMFKEPPGREHYQVAYCELPQRMDR